MESLGLGRRKKARPRSADIIGVVEAAYRLDVAEPERLRAITEAAAPHLDRGLGVHSWVYEMGPGGHISVRNGAAVGPPGYLEALQRATAAMDPALHTRCYFAGPCTTMSEAIGVEPVEACFALADGAPLRAIGGGDSLGITCLDPTGHGAAIGATLPASERPTRAMRRRWGRIAAHLAAGYRARRLLAAESPAGPGRTAGAALEGAEAVFEASGKVANLNGPAREPHMREALRRAARAVDRARGGLRGRDGDEALDLWQGLFEGRWSLMDVFDSDGRRFLVARRNDPHVPARRGLSTREFQVLAYRAQAHPLKLIAYECGLSVGTVAGYLKSACNKLGVASGAWLAGFLEASR
jgi:DNA-binding CsgD family transcriptional regulator